MPFSSIDEIDEHFRQQLAGADDDAKPQIEFARDRAKFDFERQSFAAERQARERADAIEAAVKKYPALKGSEDFLKGDDAKSIMNSAARLAEKISPRQDAAREAYGPATGVVGTPIAFQVDDGRDKVHAINRRIQGQQRLSEEEAKFFVAAVGGHAIQQIRGALRHGGSTRQQ